MLKTSKKALLSVFLAVVFVMSCIPTVAVNVAAEEASSSAQAVYYVKGGATGDGSSYDTPAGTISQLISKITADGNNVAGKKVVVKIISNDSAYFHYNFEGSSSIIPSHAATLSFESYDSENISFLSVSPRKLNGTTLSRSDAQHLKLGGPVEFRNLKLIIGRTKGDWIEMYCGGFDATFEKVRIYGYSDESYSTPAAASSDQVVISHGAYNNSADGEGGTLSIDGETINSCKFGYPVISSYASAYSDQRTFDNDVKIVLGNGTIYQQLRLGGSPGGDTVTYKKNVNIVLNGTKVPILYSRNYISAMTEGHALQIIYNNGATIASETTGTYAFTNLTRYDIHVENLEGAALDTTDVAGTYSITFPEGKTIAKATCGDKTYYSKGNTLTVGGAGSYDVVFLEEMPVLDKTYYVKGGATEGNGSESAPYGSIAEVINAMKNEGRNVEGTVITVKVIASSENTGFGEANALYINPYSYVSGGSTCSSVLLHDATVVYESADSENRASVFAANATSYYFTYLRLGGPTVFRNIDLRINRSSGWLEFFSNGYSTTYENVKFQYSNGSAVPASTSAIYQGGYQHNNGTKMGEGGTLTIDAASLARVDYVVASGNSDDNAWYYTNGYQDYDEDVKMVLTGDSIANLRIGGANSGKTIAYKKNLNIILNGTTVGNLFNRNKITAMTEGHAMQIIYNAGATISAETSVSLTRYDIHVENIAGAALDTTDVAGTYSVTFPEGYKYAVATDAEGNEYVSENGLLTVGEPGTYNVTFTQKAPGVIEYYIKGGATGDGTTPETPAGTLSALVAQLTADELNVAGEQVVVKVISNGTNYVYYNTENNAKATIPYNATLIFESYDEENPSVLGVTNSKVTVRGDQHLRISGPTVFRNIGIMFNRGYTDWMEIYCGGYDTTFENVQLYDYNLKVPTTSNGNRLISHGSVDNIVDGEGGTITVDAKTITNSSIGYISTAAGVNSYSDQLTMENDVKVVLGNAALKNEFRVGGAPEKSTIAFKKNLNIVLNGTTVPILFSRNYISAMTEGHALQIIYNNGATIASETTGTYALTNLTRYDIYVENTAGAALDTTDVAGTYSVAYPEGKNIVYYYAVDASGNYDGTTPIYYANTETITVGAPSSYKVGFVSDVSDINVEIVNEFMSFSGFANSTEDGYNGKLTPIVEASNTVETDVSAISGGIVYTCDINFAAGAKTEISIVGNVAENKIVDLNDEGLKIGGYTVAGEFGYGKYGVKLSILPASHALIAEITKPDGTVIRRGNSGMLAGNTAITKVVSKTSFEDGVDNISAVEDSFVPESYTVNEQEPVLEGFEQNVYNIVTSYNSDAKTTRNFAFTAKKSFLAEGEKLVVKYNVKGSAQAYVVEAVEKANPTTMYTDIYFLEADVTGLKAGTTYEYKIGKKDSEDASEWSETYTFTTEGENENKFSFIAIADTQGEAWGGRGFMYAQAAINKALEEVENPAFILNAGDVVEGRSSAVASDANIETMWEQYFKAMGDSVKTIPHFAAMGNHDFQGHGKDVNYLFNLHFNHPDNGSIANWNLDDAFSILKNNKAESSYSFDYGNAHFVVVNTGVTADQYYSNGTWNDPSSFWYLGTQSWLKADLEASDAEWKIVVAHIPAYDSKGPTGNWTKHQMNTYFENLGVDLVIEGHAHYTTRTYPMKNGEAVRTDGNPDVITKGEGTVYSIIGSTTTNHDNFKDNLNENFVNVFSPESEMPLYTVVDVTDRALTCTIKQLDGLVVDTFTIVNEAKYAPESLGVQIRIPTDSNVKQGMRFVSSISRDFFDELCENGYMPTTSNDTGLGFGSVIIPTNLIAEGEELTKYTDKAQIVPAVKLRKIDEEEVQFTVCLTDIPEKYYTRDYSVVPYVTVMVGDEEVTYYGEMLTADVYQIALMACAEGSLESEETKQYLKEKIIDVVEAAEN